MPSSPNRRLVLEASRRRSVARASPLSLVDAAGVKESGVVDRDLTLEEAAALVVADLPSAMGASIYKPETLKRNAILLRKYERVTKRATIDLAGIELYVRAVLRVQAHRRGLGRPTTTAESVIDNTCRVIARVWRMQNRALSIPSDMAFALQGFQKEALRTLTRSSRTVEFCDDLAFLFMRALARKYNCTPEWWSRELPNCQFIIFNVPLHFPHSIPLSTPSLRLLFSFFTYPISYPTSSPLFQRMLCRLVQFFISYPNFYPISSYSISYPIFFVLYLLPYLFVL